MNRGSYIIFSVVLTTCILEYQIPVCYSTYRANSTHTIPGGYILKGVDQLVYGKAGDLELGAIMVLSTGTTGNYCSRSLGMDSWLIHYTESVAFAVEEVNKNPTLLPNHTLGFRIVDDCDDRKVALAQSLAFLPRSEKTCLESTCDSSSNSTVSLDSSDSCNARDEIPYYDVIGILSPMWSASAVPVSYLYAVAEVPIIGHTTTSDDLSDKSLHPYFLRVVPRDKYQVLAMLLFIAKNDWSYISVLYAEGAYGERAFDTIDRNKETFNVCIAMSHRISEADDLMNVTKDLLYYQRARIVILFIYDRELKGLLSSIRTLNAVGHFVFICSDSIAMLSRDSFSSYAQDLAGAFMFMPYSETVPGFYKYLGQLDIFTTENPWLKIAWQAMANCSLSDNSCDNSVKVTEMQSFENLTMPSLAMDVVLAYAHAVHRLVADLCPHLKSTDVRKCVKGDILLKYLRNVSFEGNIGPTHFDEFNDVNGPYRIVQTILKKTEVFKNGQRSLQLSLEDKEVATYDSARNSLSYETNGISWEYFSRHERIVPVKPGYTNLDIPESVCSRPCSVGEYKIQKEPACCWTCRTCRNNERLVNNSTGCEICAVLTWPDPKTSLTTCSPIPPTYPAVSETVPLIQIFAGICGIMITVFVIVFYIHHRDARIIKASSRELSAVQLCAIFTGYITVICFQSKPTPSTCSSLFFMFCLSFACLYAPLLLKAVRIYRIFMTSSKQAKKPRFISPQSQVVMAAMLIFIQVILCIAIYYEYQPGSKLSQPDLTKEFVQVSCDVTSPGLVSFLIYNLVMVTLCSVFAFRTRKLPENFNESRFTSMCVSTTLVIWLAFCPTYFTANQEFVKTMSLSVALLLNHTAALAFLFLPKIYAALYVPPENVETEGRFQLSATSTSGSSNRVVPDHRRF